MWLALVLLLFCSLSEGSCVCLGPAGYEEGRGLAGGGLRGMRRAGGWQEGLWPGLMC